MFEKRKAKKKRAELIELYLYNASIAEDDDDRLYWLNLADKVGNSEIKVEKNQDKGFIWPIIGGIFTVVGAVAKSAIECSTALTQTKVITQTEEDGNIIMSRPFSTMHKPLK